MDTGPRNRTSSGRTRFARTVLGGAVGAIVGAIVSVNIVIFSGIEDGYEASPSQVFDESPVVAVGAALVFVGCIWGGAAVARRDIAG